jgi:hypothetical protein
MAKALNILFVHGIGWGELGKNYARPLVENITSEFKRAVRRLHLRDIDGGDVDLSKMLRFEPAYWAPITQDAQNDLLALMKLRGFWPLNRLRLAPQARKQFVSLLGDVIAYESGETNRVYKAIHGRVDDSVRFLSEKSTDDQDESGWASLTVIGHSLGSVIASDYVWDHTRGASEPYQLTTYRLSIKNMILLGSPMAVYTLRDNPSADKKELAESLDKPVQVDPKGGLWLNLYSEYDPIAFPLHPIKSYAAVDVIDCAVPIGNWFTRRNAASHTEYWKSVETAQIIAGKLALDWAALNSPAFAGDRYIKAVEDFRKKLCK